MSESTRLSGCLSCATTARSGGYAAISKRAPSRIVMARRRGRSINAIMPVSTVTRPERKSTRATSAIRGTGWIFAGSTIHDVQNPIGQKSDRTAFDLDHDDDVERCRVRHALPKTAAQIDDRHHDAAQIEDTAHIVRLARERTDLRPALDLAHRHDVDAILVVADREADELIEVAAGTCRRFGRRAGLIHRLTGHAHTPNRATSASRRFSGKRARGVPTTQRQMQDFKERKRTEIALPGLRVRQVPLSRELEHKKNLLSRQFTELLAMVMGRKQNSRLLASTKPLRPCYDALTGRRINSSTGRSVAFLLSSKPSAR